ncbi:MAG TPA: 50S ribosomal protein L21 [Patescibacteria group bacterium]|jgi:large subunit ribosomal protein L21
MAKYAVIQLLGKQHLVSEGEILIVDKVEQEPKTKLVVTDVLLVTDGKEVAIGQPTVAKAKVTLSVQDTSRGDKLRVATYKAKSRTRKVKGHRQLQSSLLVEKIVG